LRKNRIGSLEQNTFINMPRLETLILDENQITEIRARTFSNLPMLRWLYMRYGSLKVVSPEAFYGTPKLNFVHFEENKIRQIPTKLLDNFLPSKLPGPRKQSNPAVRIFLNKNPFLCNIKMKPAFSKLDNYDRNNVLDKEDLTCDWPPRNKDKNLNELKLSDLDEDDDDPTYYPDSMYEGDDDNLDIPPNNNDSSSGTGFFSMFIGTIFGVLAAFSGFIIFKKYQRGRTIMGGSAAFTDISYRDISNALHEDGFEDRQGLTGSGSGTPVGRTGHGAGSEAFM